METISVIIPAYNARRYLAEAVGSVLAQSRPATEVIVADDGSTDGTAAELDRFGARITRLRRDHGGAAAARNAGIQISKGQFIAFLDADDVWLPEKLAVQMQAFAADPNLDLVFGHVRQFVSPELSDAERSNLICDSAPLPGFSSGTMLIRKSALLRVGEFDPRFAAGEFIDWYSRAREAGLKKKMLAEVVYRRRLHRHNHGILERSARQDYLKVIKQTLDRRRGSLPAE